MTKGELECAVTALTGRVEELEKLVVSLLPADPAPQGVFEQTHRSFVPVARRMAGEA